MNESKYTIELTKEQLNKIKQLLGYKIPIESEFDRIKRQKFFYISASGNIKFTIDGNSEFDNALYEVANYCTDEKIMQQRAYHRILDDLLFRFSMQNDGDKIDWEDDCQEKWFIYFSTRVDKWRVDFNTLSKGFGNVYFISEKIAQRAIDETVKPFIKENPDFVW